MTRRAPTRPPYPIPSFRPVRHTFGTEPRPSDRAILFGRTLMDCTGSRTESPGRRGEVRDCLLPSQWKADRDDRLSQMILDQVFHGVLNESVGTLEVYDEPTEDVSDDLSYRGRKLMGVADVQ